MSVQRLLADYEGPWDFYFTTYKYKATSWPTIGFKINGKWFYDTDLPDSASGNIDAISVGSIVEGSDAVVGPRVFEGDFDLGDFWEAVEEMNREAEFYWIRDNSMWYHLKNHESEILASLHWEPFNEGPVWDEKGGFDDMVLNEIVRVVREHRRESASSEGYRFSLPGVPHGNLFSIIAYVNHKAYEKTPALLSSR